ncbi:ribosome silencing factor [SAR202 cluster bacterium AD-802-E10_MRT_200m]|nr:ribosome silencing factor [SAR202 cluster bacterium AD-802-E10_MRT_200m]MQF83102.1 ribosome silencing factor [SAR202 cluster bacterium AD-802-E10_MRT_200m]
MSKPLAIAHKAVELATEKQASDVVLLDISGMTAIADYFVICTAHSSRQLNALLEDIATGLREVGAKLDHREGSNGSGWTLLDYGDVIVHIFSPEEREYYQLESAWLQGTIIIKIQ